jgi:zinc transporter, ZIP family
VADNGMLVLLVAAAAALSNVAGGLFALKQPPTSLFTSIALGFASGLIIATVSLEMIPQAIELGSTSIAVLGFAAGFITIYGFELAIHRGQVAGELSDQYEEVARRYQYQRPYGDEVLVLAGGISIENVVQGLAIGMGFAIDPSVAVLVALAVSIDQVTEGMSIGELVKRGAEKSNHVRLVLRWTLVMATAMFVSALVGGFVLDELPDSVLAALFAFAAGGMFYITITELVPTSAKYHFQQSSALATAVGFLVILVLARVY